MFKAKMYALGAAIAGAGAFLVGTVAHAAVDSDVSSTAGSLATTIKENVVGVITTNLPIIVVAGVLIMAIFIVWRLAKRFTSGR